MQIGGIQKTTLIDYPGKVAVTLFTIGCPLRCLYCHNPELVLPEEYATPLELDDLFSFLTKRISLVQGVCITGGEPTMQRDLRSFLAQIKALGFLIKLDSNGVNPHILEAVFADGNVDYVAMDIKGPLEKYAGIVGGRSVERLIGASIKLVMGAGIDYEFRTTVARPLLAVRDFDAIGQLINGARRYFIQNYVAAGKQVNATGALQPFSQDELIEAKKTVQAYVQCVEIR